MHTFCKMFLFFIPFCVSQLVVAETNPDEGNSLSSSLVYERTIYIGVPVSQVWEALIKPEIVNRYYLAPLMKIDLRQGGQIYYGTKANRVIEGKVLKVEAEKKLVHTFKFAHRPADPISRVSYVLKPMGEMSKITLRHDGFSSTGTFNDISHGWDIILNSLKTLLETGKPLPWPKS